MKSTIQIEGILGSSDSLAEKQSTIPSNYFTSTKNQVTNVQVTASYPKTGEYQSQYLIFSGICLILLLFVLKKRKTTE